MNRVLLVENDAVQRSILLECLEQEGCGPVDSAANEEEAFAQLHKGEGLDKLHKASYEVVVTDMLMNTRDGGLRVVKEAKEVDALTQVIVLTAYGELKNAVACMEAGAFTYLEKQGEGETFDALKHKVRLAMAHRKALLGVVGFAKAISAAIELNDPYTAGHSRRVAELTRLMAAEMGWSPDQQEDAWMAAVLHDIGKLGIDAEILNKKQRLNENEFVQVRTHPTVAQEMLKGIPELGALLDAVHHHHERFDGDKTRCDLPAYPGEEMGEGIALIARLIAVADTFDALTSDRPYRNSRADPNFVEVAVAQICSERGKRFAPEAVDAFLVLWGKGRLDEILNMGPRIQAQGEVAS